jgi:hypothetical protein
MTADEIKALISNQPCWGNRSEFIVELNGAIYALDNYTLTQLGLISDGDGSRTAHNFATSWRNRLPKPFQINLAKFTAGESADVVAVLLIETGARLITLDPEPEF